MAWFAIELSHHHKRGYARETATGFVMVDDLASATLYINRAFADNNAARIDRASNPTVVDVSEQVPDPLEEGDSHVPQ